MTISDLPDMSGATSKIFGIYVSWSIFYNAHLSDLTWVRNNIYIGYNIPNTLKVVCIFAIFCTCF